MKKLLLLISTFFISTSLLAQIEIPKSHEIKFLPRSPFLDSLNNKLFIQPLDTSFSFTDTFFKQKNKLNKKDSTKIETVSNIDINQKHLKNNKNIRRHGFGVGCTLLSSEFFPTTNIVYFSLSHRYLFNKKSNNKFLFLQSTYNSVYNYSKTIKTSQMFNLDIGYDIRFYDNDIWGASFWNIFFTSGIANITLVSYSTIYQKEADKIIARNKLNSTLIKHRIGFGGGNSKLNLDMGFSFLYNFKKGVLNEQIFGADINFNYYIKRK